MESNPTPGNTANANAGNTANAAASTPANAPDIRNPGIFADPNQHFGYYFNGIHYTTPSAVSHGHLQELIKDREELQASLSNVD